MKKLQQNFTTPEQSKKLLELGVPADSADCYHNQIAEKPFILSMPYSYSNWDDKDNPPLPCWSVGRLMEIFTMCCLREQTSNCGWCSYRRLHRNQTYLDYILRVFTINKMRGLLDFSKLED